MKSETNTERTVGQTKRNRRTHSVREKSLAVLTVWAEKRRASVVCRQLGISWSVLNQWEKQALRGMLQELGRREEPNDQPVSLSKRVERLIQEAVQPAPIETSAPNVSPTP